MNKVHQLSGAGAFKVLKADLQRWKDAVIDALVVSYTLNAENENDPRRALNDLAAWAQMVALDPAVSLAAAELRDTYKASTLIPSCVWRSDVDPTFTQRTIWRTTCGKAGTEDEIPGAFAHVMPRCCYCGAPLLLTDTEKEKP